MIDTRSWRRQPLAALAAGCFLFAFGLHLGFYVAREPRIYKLRPWGPSNAHVGSQSSPVLLPSHAESSSPDLNTNSSFQPSGSNPVNGACLAYPSLDSDVVIVVKTGATEALNRIPTQLLTFLSCAKDDVLIFSDTEQEIGEFHVYDAIVDVVDEARIVNSDFELYEMQKQVKMFGEDISSLSKGKEAWALDKYKNIHTAQKAWELRPNKSWYFFIDADTYIVWPSFFAWLKRVDPAKDLYLGNTIHTHRPFAHGGSGYLISRTGMVEIAGGEDARKVAADFDVKASTTCCGDAEIAWALFLKDVSLIDAYPLINEHKPRNMPFGPLHWCQPVITMHHMSPEEINDMWQFERSRPNPETPLLFAELFSTLVFPKLSSQRTDWDNLSDEEPIDYPAAQELEPEHPTNITHKIQEENDESKETRDLDPRSHSTPTFNATSTTLPEQFPEQHSPFWPPDPNPNDYDTPAVTTCARLCRETPDCFQYLWNGTSCKLSTKFFTLGGMKEVENEEKRWVSGWDLERVKDFQSKNGHCGSGLWEYHE